ncbi:protein kinase activating protein dpb11 [Coniosporium tulheliwenetii]|uniref:Protein kinase activating protein dpb11 n=1 Tax=Coniosporium tulheliwenetii TaxID=3383036 RepID=A0ACC2YRN2_9PEZI|nr:protein kinase activating protein dpb11 [Cladosporium sp. JES 115]
MGAIHKYDLTSDVTHLIVGNIDTPKYKYVAKNRPDVKVVTPAWVGAVRDSWMEGGDTDVEALENEYRVPTFSGLRICVTGFEDLAQRDHIAKTVAANGAEYHGDLTKAVTHLIAAVPSGKKYEYARMWQVTVVSLEWFRESVERGMVLEEELYDPVLPPEQRGQGAWKREPEEAVTLGKRARDAEHIAAAGDSNRRKLRRTASTKLGSQSQSIWADMASFGPSKSDPVHGAPSGGDVGAQRKLVAQPATGAAGPQLDRRSNADAGNSMPTVGNASAAGHSGNHGIFGGRVVCIIGFDSKQTSILQTHLNANEAQVVIDLKDLDMHSPDELAQGFLVIPHDLPRDQWPARPEVATQLSEVTEWWVEACLHRKTLIDPVDEVLCKPFKRLGIDGGTYDEYLKPTTSVLVCNSATPNKEKLKYASEHNVPAVSALWLWASIETAKMQPFDKYLLNAPQKVKDGPRKQGPFVDGADDEEYEEGAARDIPNQANAELPRTKRPNPEFERITPQSREKPPENTRARTRDARHFDPSHPADQELKDSLAGSHMPVQPVPTPPPLQDLPPEINSPRRPSPPSHRSSSAKSKPDSLESTAEQEPAPAVADPAISLNNTIAQLLAQKQASKPTTAPPESNLQRRRRSRLGRAPSLQSNLNHPLHLLAHQLAQRQRTSGLGSLAEVLPSQALIYEDEDVQRQREHLIRKMGGRVEQEGGKRVQGIGMVRDIFHEEGGGRARRRGRAGNG